MYTIKQAAAMAGVETSTLRAWENRYGVVTPRRSAGGYRVYDDREVATIRSMRELISNGWSAAQAAEQVKSELDPRAAAEPEAPLGLDPALLVKCGEDFDAVLLTRVLDQAFSGASFEHVVVEWLLPALEELGHAWSSGRITIAGEHFVTAAVQRRLGIAFEAAANPAAGPTVVVGLPAESRHELGVLIFATLLRRQGVRTRYLGADLPTNDWVLAVRTIAPTAVVLAAPMDTDVTSVQRTIDAISAADAGVRIFVGGAAHAGVSGAEPLGHAMVEAARDLAEQLQRQPQSV